VSLFDLTGKVAVVTGATKGIGRGIVQQLAAHGAKVVVSSRNQAEAEAVAGELDAEFGAGRVIAKGAVCDLDRLDDIDSFAKNAEQAFGAVDILVCNAAALAFVGQASTTPPDVFERLLSTNIHHNFRLCEALRGAIASRGGGAIVLIGSLAGHQASPNLLAYGVAKAGVAHMARCLADEMAAENIRVNCIAPGLIRSYSSRPLWRNEAMLRASEAGIPLQRIGEPEDVAGTVVFLVSRAGSYVTGETILVDGGRTQLSSPRADAGALSAVASSVNAGSRPGGSS
jgi:NAD(P)-dependent dehydrogenase (short-subunit alcohol dehydrogenase family)